MSTSKKLVADPTIVEWCAVRYDRIETKAVKIVVSEDTSEWRIRSCPWWLNAEWTGGKLMLQPRNCGRHCGTIQFEAGGERVAVGVRAHVQGRVPLACWTAAKIFLIGLVTVALAVFLGMLCGLGVPLLGGPVGVAFAGAVFCGLWGLVIGGRTLGTRTFIAGGISLLIAAVLVVLLLLYGSSTVGDLIAFRIALAVAGTVVGAAIGAVSGGAQLAVRGALVGLAAWLTASLIAVPRFTAGTGVGPLIFLALLFTPGIGLTIWGIVIGGLLAPYRRIPIAVRRGAEQEQEVQNRRTRLRRVH